jgi:tRNA-dihydrouridine synthase A
MNKINRLFSVAPMLDRTDRHCRYFYRLMSQQSLLYTEMITTGALIQGNRQRFLDYHPQEHPLALQLGGSNPIALARAAKMAEDYGYDEINLNVGCPSDRVQNGLFGACLMAKPTLVADCIVAMQQAVSIPVTVKSRIGIDHHDSYEHLSAFIQIVAEAGCKTFIIHARKAWLQGLSPKQNREIPPLRYEDVYQLKKDFSALEIILNGGITQLETATIHLNHVDGVMLGREIYQQPFLLTEVDSQIFSQPKASLTRQQIIEQIIPYVQQQLKQGIRLNSITRHLLGLFHGQQGAKGWRRYLSDHASQISANENVLLAALKFTV